jgi:hypothetical protein
VFEVAIGCCTKLAGMRTVNAQRPFDWPENLEMNRMKKMKGNDHGYEIRQD